jgi:uncharacterized protein
MNSALEEACVFDCGSDAIVGVLNMPAHPSVDFALLIVVGGPQYRVGSHRQFVLTARSLASVGVPVLRFDCRGMGDSEGNAPGFQSLCPDIRAAIDYLFRKMPGLAGVVLYGLCDGAAAALICAVNDPRISGLILCNPWVRSTEGEARAYLKHYYVQRFLQRSFWSKLLSGRFDYHASFRGLLQMLQRAGGNPVTKTDSTATGFVLAMLKSMQTFAGPVLLLISGRDLTAQEFQDLCRKDSDWRRAIARANVTALELPEADHTFSMRASLECANDHCAKWLRTRMPQRSNQGFGRPANAKVVQN